MEWVRDYLFPKECPWPEDDYRCKSIWGKLVKDYMENWKRMEATFPERWAPPKYNPITGPRIFLDFKPVVFEWFRKYEVTLWGTPFILRPGFGSCVLVGIMGGWIISWNYRKVLRARKKYNVPNPLSVSDSQEFNYMWRAYQSVVEAYPTFLFFVLLGGIEYPFVTSFLGSLWLVGRVISSLAWQSRRPRLRYLGSFYVISDLLLIWATWRAAQTRMQFWKGRLPDFLAFKPEDAPIEKITWIEKYLPEFYARRNADGTL